MQAIFQISFLALTLASCSEIGFNREANRTSTIKGTLTEDSKQLALAYTEALREGRSPDFALTGEEISESKIKKFRYRLYQLMAEASLAEGCSESKMIEVSAAVPLALDHAGISPTPDAVARVTAISFSHCELSDSGREQVVANSLAIGYFDENQASAFTDGLMARLPDDKIGRVARALYRNSDQLGGDGAALLASIANGANGRQETAVAGIMADVLELMEENDISYDKSSQVVERFRAAVDPSLREGSLKDVFKNLDDHMTKMGKGVREANAGIVELNQSLTKAKALAATLSKARGDKKSDETSGKAAKWKGCYR